MKVVCSQPHRRILASSHTLNIFSPRIAAILLDPEAQSPTLDADPTQGSLKEPILKLTNMIRSMDVQWDSFRSLRKLRHRGLYRRLGQGAYESEGGVFSFFLPEYTPPGVVDTAGLVAPESQVLSGSKVSKLIDGILTTYKNGLTNCENGFGYRLEGGCPTVEGDYSTAEGVLAYAPEATTVDALIDELSLMLTAGRLGDTNRAIVKGAIEPYFAGNRPKAIRIAQQLITSSPEFHTTGLARKGDKERVITGYTQSPKHDYKAIVYLFMVGGCDSFNMLVPLSGCSTVSIPNVIVTALNFSLRDPNEYCSFCL